MVNIAYRAKRIDCDQYVEGLPHLEYGTDINHKKYEKWYIRRWDKAKNTNQNNIYYNLGEEYMYSSSYQVDPETFELTPPLGA